MSAARSTSATTTRTSARQRTCSGGGRRWRFRTASRGRSSSTESSVSTTSEGVVPFLDLRRRIDSIRPAMDARLARVFESGRFILGEAVAELEREFAKYCRVRDGVAVASGTDALWLALEALGIGAGDEVITVSNTCAPTVAAIVKSGATPVLVDVDPATLTIDPERAEAALSSR